MPPAAVTSGSQYWVLDDVGYKPPPGADKVMRRAMSCLDVYGPRPIATGLANSGPRVTTADVYPASLCGLSDHRREPRWIFARFPLNDAKALAETMPVQTPGSGSDGVTVWRQRSEKLQQLVAPDRLGEHNAPGSINAMNLKHVLGQIEPDGRDGRQIGDRPSH